MLKAEIFSSPLEDMQHFSSLLLGHFLILDGRRQSTDKRLEMIEKLISHQYFALALQDGTFI